MGNDIDNWLISSRREQMKAQSVGGQAVTQLNDKKKVEQDSIAKEKSNELFTQNKLMSANIKRDDYNFEEMYKEQGGFSSEGDNILMPNKFRAPLKQEVAGYDLGTGRQERKVYKDADGIGRNAIELLRTSFADSKDGRPKEDAYPLSQIAYLALKEGKTEAEYSKSISGYAPPIMQQSWVMAQRVRDVEDYEKYLEAGALNVPDAPERKLPVQIKHEELPSNSIWINSSRAFFEAAYGPIQEGVTTEDINKQALALMSQWSNNLTTQAVWNSRISSLDENAKKAFYNMMLTYDNIDTSGNTGEYVGRAALAVVSDPATYVGGVAGTLAYKKLATKTLGTRAYSPILLAAIASAPEGFFYGGFQEYGKQKAEIEGGARANIDAGKVTSAAASGAALTAGAVSGIGLTARGATTGTNAILNKIKEKTTEVSFMPKVGDASASKPASNADEIAAQLMRSN